MNEMFWMYMRKSTTYIREELMKNNYDVQFEKEIDYIRDEVLGHGTLMLYK